MGGGPISIGPFILGHNLFSHRLPAKITGRGCPNRICITSRLSRWIDSTKFIYIKNKKTKEGKPYRYGECSGDLNDKSVRSFFSILRSKYRAELSPSRSIYSAGTRISRLALKIAYGPSGHWASGPELGGPPWMSKGDNCR